MRFAIFILAGLCASCRSHVIAERHLSSSDSARIATAHDSLAFDYPSGYYFPMDTVQVLDWELAWLELPYSNVVLSRFSQDSTFDCSQALVRPDTIDLRCPTTPIGSIHVNGAFTDLIHGWQNADLTDNVIMSCTVTIEDKGRVVFSKRIRFRYWAGD